MTGHTKEPWACTIEAQRYPESDDADYPAIIRNTSGDVILFVPEEYRDHGDYEANAHRIVACVNALAGIENPAAFMEAARGMREALEEAGVAFRYYHELHAAKDTPEGRDKARINLDLAVRTEAALRTFDATLGEQ